MGRRAHTSENADGWFWPQVDKSGECWIWTGTRTREGYGTVKFKYRATTAHRVAWELTNGPINELSGRLCLCHNCPGGDNPLCVNPAHMFIGTYSDNQKDRWEKFRADPANDHALYVDHRGVERYNREALWGKRWHAWPESRRTRSVKDPAASYTVGVA